MKTISRHGKLADGKTRLSVVIESKTKDALEAIAKADDRSTSRFVVRELEKIVNAAKEKKRQDEDNETSKLTLSQTANPSLAPRISKRKPSAA
jgi:hypothetical protein